VGGVLGTPWKASALIGGQGDELQTYLIGAPPRFVPHIPNIQQQRDLRMIVRIADFASSMAHKCVSGRLDGYVSAKRR
jgi:hypothetical protein